MAETAPRARRPASWADLPGDLAGRVLCLLPACADRARFAAVCPQWRAVARQLHVPPPLPLLALPDGTFYSFPYGKSYRFPGFGCAGYKNAAGGRWLVFPRDDACFLVDPFAGATVTLPPLSRVRLRPPNAVAKHVQIAVPWQKEGFRMDAPHTTWMHINDSKKMPVLNKMILCSQNLVAAFAGCTIDGCGRTSQILLCQPESHSWSVRANHECRLFDDMAFYRGKLYAIADDENLLIIDISQDPSTGDPEVSRIGRIIKGDPGNSPSMPDIFHTTGMVQDPVGKKKLYLVESCGALLMVRRTGEAAVAGQCECEFEVFKADFERSRWVNETTLGDDQMIFLGRPCYRAVTASQYGMPGDQIFFLDDVMENRKYSFDEETTSVGVYDMRTGKVSSPLPMTWKHEMILPTWLFPYD